MRKTRMRAVPGVRRVPKSRAVEARRAAPGNRSLQVLQLGTRRAACLLGLLLQPG